jgi:DNA-binding transcriptional regulator YhcF (GntR family)
VAAGSRLKYVQFADQLRQQIESGEFKAGDRLPSYAELRERHGLTQPTIDRGHALLERDGYIERIKGRGTFVALGKAPHAARESGWSLLRKSVVVLAPEIEVPLSGHRQSGWTEYLVLGAIHQLRLNKQPIITLDRSSIKAQDVRQLAEEQPAGVIVIGDP